MKLSNTPQTVHELWNITKTLSGEVVLVGHVTQKGYSSETKHVAVGVE
jgi:hypothetical protein